MSPVPSPNIRPAGWLQSWLEMQAEGLTGHLHVAGFPFDSELWKSPRIPFKSGAPWWPYEQTAYWIDGMYRCGIHGGIESLIHLGEDQVEHVLQHADTDGYLGPRDCKPFMPAGRWSHAIFFRAAFAHHERIEGQDSDRCPEALARHFIESKHDHSGHRDVACIESMLWAWARTGKPELLEMAESTWNRYQETGEDDDVDLKSEVLADVERPATAHGVTFIETMKLGAQLFMATGKRAYLQDSLNGYEKLQRHHMLVSGAPSSTESLRGTTALDAHETCDITDFAWACRVLLSATGEARFADAIERDCLNALPSAVTKDFRALQYFSGPNQVILANNSTYTLAAAGSKFMTYRPRPGTECCSAQVNRAMPIYVGSMWMEDDGGPVAALYGACTHEFSTTDGTHVRIREETEFPFEEVVRFHIESEAPATFGLTLRIPGWCEGASVMIDGEEWSGKALRPGTFVTIHRVWASNSEVRLHLPMKVVTRAWPDDGVSFEHGPLVYSLQIQERREVDPKDPHQTEAFPAWEMFPDSEWNYGITEDFARATESVEVVRKTDMPDQPWAQPPVRLKVSARKIPEWKIRYAQEIDSIGGELIDPARNKWRLFPKKVQGDFALTPALPDENMRQAASESEDEMVELVPIGATCLRLTIFPMIRG